MIIKKTKIKKINLDLNKRLIFVSDIHGDVDLLRNSLNEMNFSSDDYLFIIGDIIEKGDFKKNLETLRFVKNLSLANNVYIIAGNCDQVFRFVKIIDDKNNVIDYILNKKSIIKDIAYEMNYHISYEMDLNDFVNKMELEYHDLIDFINNLDDVIFINEKIVLVHGGIFDLNNIPEESFKIQKNDKFYQTSNEQPLLMIVGHCPTTNYRTDISSCNPIFDFKKKIISIDGGNHIVKGGQLNFVTIDSLANMKFSYKYFDHYPKHVMKYNAIYDAPKTSFNITYGDNEVEIISEDLDFKYIKHLKTNEMMWVHSSFIYEISNKFYCYDGCNQFISVKENDVISIVIKGAPYSLIKKNGEIGLIETRFLE